MKSALPAPYYADDLVRIYCADNAEILPLLADVDLIFTSPPYNIGSGNGRKAARDSRRRHRRWNGVKDRGVEYDNHQDDMSFPQYESWQRDVLDLCWAALSDDGAIFYNHKPRVIDGRLWIPDFNWDLPLRQIITWARSGGINYSPTYYVPTYEWILIYAKSAWRLRDQAASGVGDVWRVHQEPNSLHPAPFPVGLPARAIETTSSRLVLDPFMGSGSTLVAAKRAGVPSVGIEKSERYCEIAVQRLNQGSLAF